MALQKTYASLSVKELKHRARAQDPIASVLFRAASYGASLRAVLWVVIVLSAAGSFHLLEEVAPAFLAFVLVAATLAYGFVWMPAHKATKVGMRVAVFVTPAVVWIMDRLHPLVDKLVRFVRKHRPITVHTGLYDRDDLLNVIEAQKHQPDSRISTETLDLLAHALTFGDKLVRDCMVPRRAVNAVAADQAVTPALIDELHKSGHSRFPVYAGQGFDDKSDDGTGGIVGLLYLRDLVTLKKTGTAREAMHATTYFVHEDHPLEQVLDAFIKTHHHLFVVVNDFEEFVGIITVEDILEQVIGCKIVDEFDQYDDVRAVAAHNAKVAHDARKKKGAEAVQHPVFDKPAEEAKPENPYPVATLKHVIYEAGFRGEALEIAFAVALAESSAKVKAHNDDASTGDDSYGLFQINMLGDMGPERRGLYKLKDNAELFDPLTNARVAFGLSDGGKDWKPWTMYTNGTYKKYFDKKANHKLK